MKKITLTGKKARSLTDKDLERIEEEIREIYEQATYEAEEKLYEYMSQYQDADSKEREALDQLYIEYQSGNVSYNDYKAAKRQYEKWFIGLIMAGTAWELIKNSIATDMVNASLKAESVIKRHIATAYVINYNFSLYEFETKTLVDLPTYGYAVDYILRENPNLLPQYNINASKQLIWDKQKINSAIMKGILKGESIEKIAKRLRDVTNMDYKTSIRNARTASGAAANRGKIDSFSRIKKLGFDIKKQWVSTLDNRTRHEHRLLMGQTVNLGEPFKVEGYELEYPCDPNAKMRDHLGRVAAISVIKAAPEMVYNCRCVIVGIIAGFEKTIEDFNYQQNPKLHGMTLEEWRNAKPIYGKRVS